MQELQRFIDAQQTSYETARSELLNGKKQSHWMWYIFPQLKGLGNSSMSRYYGISGKEEAFAYLQHPLLGARLRELTDLLLSLSCKDPRKVMGCPDDLKLRSCMTLFYCVSQEERFQRVLDQYFDGQKDEWTIHALQD